MAASVSVNSGDFANIIRCLSMLKDYCDDITIRDGIIRQRTRDKNNVVEIDLTSILGTDISMILASLKEKIDILKTFLGQDVEIKVDDENSVYFSDSYSTFKFLRVREEYLPQKFMPETDIPTLEEEDKILTYDVPEIVSTRVRVVGQSFNINRVSIKFENEVCSINAEAESKDKFANFSSNIVTEKARNFVTVLNHFPFIIDHDNTIKVEIFETPMLCKFMTSIENIGIKIYCRIYVKAQETEEDE